MLCTKCPGYNHLDMEGIAIVAFEEYQFLPMTFLAFCQKKNAVEIPFRLTNAPPPFQRLMESCLEDFYLQFLSKIICTTGQV